MKLTVILSAVGILETFFKGLKMRLGEFEIRKITEIIQTTAGRIHRKVLRKLAISQTPGKDHH